MKKITVTFLSALFIVGLLCTSDTSASSKVKVTYINNNGETNSMISVESGTNPEELTPVKAGYTFSGWYTDKEFTKPWDMANDKVENDTTLYAKWQANKYTLTYETNGGNALKKETIAYDTNPKEVTPIKKGYTFKAWYKDKELTKLWDTKNGKIKQNTTLYARWQCNLQSVTFNTISGKTITKSKFAKGVEATKNVYKKSTSSTYKIKNQSNTDVLVNKYNTLSSSYVPSNLVSMGNGQKLRKEAQKAFKDVNKELKKQNKKIYLISTYRSFDRQKTLYNGYLKNNGKEYAEKTSAKAGMSEHQTGLAMDVLNKSSVNGSLTNSKFEKTSEYKWLVNNGYKYGLILRYPKGSESITGYKFEPWHWRYVGVDIATYMKENNIDTLEEFYEKY